MACIAGQSEVAEYLLEAGAVCNEYTFDGDRCHYAALTSTIRQNSASQYVIVSHGLTWSLPMPASCLEATSMRRWIPSTRQRLYRQDNMHLVLLPSACKRPVQTLRQSSQHRPGCASWNCKAICWRHRALLRQYEQRPPPLAPLAASLRALSTLCDDLESPGITTRREHRCLA